MAKKKFEQVTDTVEEVNVPVIRTATVIADRLNIRSKASTDSKVVRVANAGEKFELVDPDLVDGFYKIKEGYVMANFVSVE